MRAFRVYGFSYKNPERKQRMDERFGSVGLTIEWVETVEKDDPRCRAEHRRTDAVMHNHLDMIRCFLQSDNEFGVFCEDDVRIRRDLPAALRIAFDAYRRMGLDVLLAGYLVAYPIMTYHSGEHNPVEPVFGFFDYHDQIWGSQMYILDRAGAAKVLEAFADPASVPAFSPDWTITKLGRRAIIYPMLAVEEGSTQTDHRGHQDFHARCASAQYDPALHI
jgi:hypothetical protein